MNAYYFMYGLVLWGVPISLIDNAKVRRQCQLLYFGFILAALALFAGLRAPTVDHDYLNYLDWFNRIAAGTASNKDLVRDPAFGLTALIVAHLGVNFLAVALTYAVFCMLALSYFAIIAVCNRWLTLYFYLLFCDYFIVGEMTEIRAMVAIPLMAISIYFACAGEKRNRSQSISSLSHFTFPSSCHFPCWRFSSWVCNFAPASGCSPSCH